MSNAVTFSKICPVCNQLIKLNKETIRFGENNYGHIHQFYDDLNILDIKILEEKKIATFFPLNIKPWNQAFEAFPLIYERLSYYLQETKIEIQSYSDNSPEIQDITAKFLALKRICLKSNISYNKKMQTFFTKKLKEEYVYSNDNLSVQIDFFAKKTGVSISISNALRAIQNVA